MAFSLKKNFVIPDEIVPLIADEILALTGVSNNFLKKNIFKEVLDKKRVNYNYNPRSRVLRQKTSLRVRVLKFDTSFNYSSFFIICFFEIKSRNFYYEVLKHQNKVKFGELVAQLSFQWDISFDEIVITNGNAPSRVTHLFDDSKLQARLIPIDCKLAPLKILHCFKTKEDKKEFLKNLEIAVKKYQLDKKNIMRKNIGGVKIPQIVMNYVLGSSQLSANVIAFLKTQKIIDVSLDNINWQDFKKLVSLIDHHYGSDAANKFRAEFSTAIAWIEHDALDESGKFC